MNQNAPFLAPLVVSCELAAPLAGAPPMLDALAICLWAVLRHCVRPVRRCDPAPDVLRLFAAERFPLGYTVLGGHVVPHASSPILSAVVDDRHAHYHRRFPVGEAVRLCDAEARGVVPTTMTWTKSYRLPNRVRTARRVAWIVEGNARELRKLIRDVQFLGKDRGHGWGVVARRTAPDGATGTAVGSWDIRKAPHLAGQWWYARHSGGSVLMRPMPVGDHLPADLIGARRDYAACSPPYWHPDRYTETVMPC